MKKTNTSFSLAIGWFLIITILLCIPGTKLPKIGWQDKVWLDKWIHIFLFMMLVVLWCRFYSAKKNKEANTRKKFLQIMILGIVYGIAMELVQKYFIPLRSFDLGDITADAIGCIAGYFISIRKFDPR